MAKLLFTILISISISTNILLGDNICSHYGDKDCIDPKVTKNGHYVNQWTVRLPNMSKKDARQLLEESGFVYLGQIEDGSNLHLVTKNGTPEKHVMRNEDILKLLRTKKQVESVAQKHMIDNSPDEVYSIYDEQNVKCESLDPETIKLNDGKDNLERIKAALSDETQQELLDNEPISRFHQPDGQFDETNDVNNF